MLEGQDVSIAVLCGGQSRRFGKQKCLVTFEGKPLVSWTIERYRRLGCPCWLVLHQGQESPPGEEMVLTDPMSSRSALTGIQTALAAAGTSWVFIIAGDMPFVPLSFIRGMWHRRRDFDIVVPRTDEGYQPLCALYHRRCLSHVEEQLSHKDYTVYHFYPHVRMLEIDPETLDTLRDCQEAFFNINTPQDYERARSLWSSLDADKLL